MAKKTRAHVPQTTHLILIIDRIADSGCEINIGEKDSVIRGPQKLEQERTRANDSMIDILPELTKLFYDGSLRRKIVQ